MPQKIAIPLRETSASFCPNIIKNKIIDLKNFILGKLRIII
jgi:hypothetical protein